MIYRVELRPAAARALGKINRLNQRRIQGAVSLLAADPRPPGATPLRGRPGWRIRVGDYRVIYTIEDRVLLVVVIAVSNRREVYKR
ncbi:MAG: type II toxin-antitoxin system RelE/ParE family toxin [Bifidobacteriaceae bacterium]|nr:type II toxin-antitoxin system RelE/ParE family toxin [Bifidobacteriaceae bacterium]